MNATAQPHAVVSEPEAETEEPILITAEELARLFSLKTRMIDAYRRRGVLPFIAINERVIRYPRNECLAALHALQNDC